MKKAITAIVLSVIVLLFAAKVIEFYEQSNTDYSQVERASARQIEFIQQGLEPKSNQVGRCYTIKSTNHKNAWYVIAQILGDGLDGADYGIWIISGDKEQPNGIQSVDGLAVKFSKYTRSSETITNAKITDAECKKLKAYVKYK